MGKTEWLVVVVFAAVLTVVTAVMFLVTERHESLVQACIADGNKEYTCRGIGPLTKPSR